MEEIVALGDVNDGAVVGEAGAGGLDEEDSGEVTAGHDGIGQGHGLLIIQAFPLPGEFRQTLQGVELNVDDCVEVCALLLHIVAQRMQCVPGYRGLFVQNKKDHAQRQIG